jgi:hypothetical protein
MASINVITSLFEYLTLAFCSEKLRVLVVPQIQILSATYVDVQGRCKKDRRRIPGPLSEARDISLGKQIAEYGGCMECMKVARERYRESREMMLARLRSDL